MEIIGNVLSGVWNLMNAVTIPGTSLTVRNLILGYLGINVIFVFCKSIFGIGMSADNSVSVSRSGSSSRSIVVSSRRKDDEF